MNQCRICLQSKENMKNIFNTLLTETSTVSEIITFCTGLMISLDDGFSSSICNDCLANLHIAQIFKETALKSNEQLLNIKKEIIIKEDKIEVSVDCDYECEDYKDIMPIKNNGKKTKLITKKSKEQKKPKVGKKSRKEVIEKSTSEDNIVLNLNCDECNIPFETKREFVEHQKIHKKWICEICGRVFVHRSTHCSHVRTHFEKFCCDYCGYESRYKFDLVKHINMHNGVKKYQCEFCISFFTTASNLRSHIKRCHEKEKKYQCTICGYRSFDKIKLDIHIDMHNDIKRHTCNLCGINYRRKQSLYKHIRKRHGVEPSNIKPGRQKLIYSEIPIKDINFYILLLILIALKCKMGATNTNA